MLLEFKVQNFRSIRDEQTLSMIGGNYSEDLPNNYTVPGLQGMGASKVLKTAAIYGANASGKSNLVSALKFLASFVANSFIGIKPDSPTGVQPFAFEEASRNAPTTFEITALIENVRYTYGLALTGEKVVEEYLVAFPNGRPQTWFEREWNAAEERYDWSPSTENFKYDEVIRRSTRDNCAFLSVGSQFDHQQLVTVYQWFNKGLEFIDMNKREVELSRTISACEEGDTRWLLELMRDADLGITDLSVKQISKDRKWDHLTPAAQEQLKRLLPHGTEQYEIKLSHQSREGIATLNFEEESTGTKRYFGLAGYWLEALSEDKTILVDEIETSLHPFLVRELIALFQHEEVKSGKAQLIFTTHNPVLLDQTMLRRDQFWFTEKDKTGATVLYPLTDYHPRPGEALMKGYLAGRYGGVPFIPKNLVTPAP